MRAADILSDANHVTAKSKKDEIVIYTRVNSLYGMTNILLLVGTGYLGEDVFHKLPWALHLNPEHKIHVISRIDPDIHLSTALKHDMKDRHIYEIQESIERLKMLCNDYSILYLSDIFSQDFETEDIERIQSWLGISFRYISSFDRRFYSRESYKDKRSEDEVNKYAAALVEFYRQYFTTNDIDVLINTIEDDLFSVAAYYTAKKMGVQVIGFMSGRFPKRGVMFCEDFRELCVWNTNPTHQDDVVSLYDSSTIVGVETRNKNIHYFKLTSIKEKMEGINYIAKYTRFRRDIIDIYPFEEFIYPDSSIFNGISNFLVKSVRRLLIRSVTKEANFNEKYLFYPLHYMDDAQITFREPLTNQYQLIYHISRALPSGYYLYVKPHPHYLGTDTSFKELYKISKLGNVKIIPPSLPPINMIRNSQAVITINSTTGFEALIMKHPVITFGHDFYCKDDLTCVIRDINELSKSICMCLNKNNNKHSDQEYIFQVYNNTIWISTLGEEYYPAFTLSDQDGKSIAFALNKILKKYHDSPTR